MTQLLAQDHKYSIQYPSFLKATDSSGDTNIEIIQDSKPSFFYTLPESNITITSYYDSISQFGLHNNLKSYIPCKLNEKVAIGEDYYFILGEPEANLVETDIKYPNYASSKMVLNMRCVDSWSGKRCLEIIPQMLSTLKFYQ